MRFKPRHSILLIIALLTTSAFAQSPPPKAPVRNVIDEYWGVKVSDPYRYMENLDDPEVQAWIKAQAEYTAATMDKIPGRDSLAERIKELDAGSPYRVFSIRRMPDGRIFHEKEAADENLAKLYVRASMDADERLLIDPSTMKTETGGHYSLYFYQPSFDGRYVAYGLSPSGSENVTLHVLDVNTGKDLPDRIDRLEPYYTPPQWLPDNSGFFYNRLPLLGPEDPPTEGYKNTKTYRHRLGRDPEDEPPVFAKDLWPGIEMSEEDFPSIVVPRNSDYVIGKIKHGDAREMTLYSAPLSTVATDDMPWKQICTRTDSVTDFDVHGDQIYLLTSHDAPHFKVVRTSLASPGFANADVVIPNGSVVLRSVNAAKDALYVTSLNAGMSEIIRVDYATGDAKVLEYPDGAPSGYIVSYSSRVDGILVGTASWVKRGKTYAYDPATDSFTDTGLNPQGKYDNPADIASVEVEVTSHDGVKVPLSIIYKRGIELDGSNPTLLSGYGAYGSVSSPYFSPTRLAWLERGGVYAVAHVRGGGEHGREWHLAGQKTTKPNTWKDFNACAEYLIEQGYTSPDKLAGQGGSAGGILIGRAITSRPDLYAAALIGVGCLDAIRMETTTNGIPNIQEFGTVKKEDEFHGLLEMSSYDHVTDGTVYPAVMLAHGINDPRVEPWMPAKMCARLQAAQAGDRPILFRVDYGAGHGIGSRKDQYQSLIADEWAFLLWQFGDPEFQPES
jgi:prolyl oligopeptidase